MLAVRLDGGLAQEGDRLLLKDVLGSISEQGDRLGRVAHVVSSVDLDQRRVTSNTQPNRS